MSVVVRMARHGGKKRPFYRMVVADSRFSKEGRFIEILGNYDPASDLSTYTMKGDRVEYWANQGAQFSPIAKKLWKLHKKQNPNAETKDA